MSKLSKLYNDMIDRVEQERNQIRRAINIVNYCDKAIEKVTTCKK